MAEYPLFLSLQSDGHNVGPVIAVQLAGVGKGVGEDGRSHAAAAVVHLQVEGARLICVGWGLPRLLPAGGAARQQQTQDQYGAHAFFHRRTILSPVYTIQPLPTTAAPS